MLGHTWRSPEHTQLTFLVLILRCRAASSRCLRLPLGCPQGALVGQRMG